VDHQRLAVHVWHIQEGPFLDVQFMVGIGDNCRLRQSASPSSSFLPYKLLIFSRRRFFLKKSL
jgi:hypothetical protein